MKEPSEEQVEVLEEPLTKHENQDVQEVGPRNGEVGQISIHRWVWRMNFPFQNEESEDSEEDEEEEEEEEEPLILENRLRTRKMKSPTLQRDRELREVKKKLAVVVAKPKGENCFAKVKIRYTALSHRRTQQRRPSIGARAPQTGSRSATEAR